MNKSSQIVQNLFFLGKVYGFFWIKLTFLKSAKDRKFVVGCNWISQISQNVEKVAYPWEKKIGFSKKQSWVLLRTAESSQFDAKRNQLTRISQNGQNLVFFWKKNRLGFRKNSWFFQNSQK